MRHTTAMPCPHGERTDRTTSTGEPLCPLCRNRARQTAEADAPQVDWQMLRAGDDTMDDDPRHNLSDGFAASDSHTLATMFVDDARSRSRLRRRTRTNR